MQGLFINMTNVDQLGIELIKKLGSGKLNQPCIRENCQCILVLEHEILAKLYDSI